MGHRRVGHITGPPGNLHARLRREGYLEAMRTAGLAVASAWTVEGDSEEDGGRYAMRALLEHEDFTAVFAGKRLAAGALHALRERDLRCPQDVSLVAFDDQHSAAFTTPPLTTVRQPLGQLGRLAADRLLRAIRGEHEAGRPGLPPLALVERASVQRREVP